MEKFKLISGREHGSIWLENELRKQLKKNKLNNKYGYVMELEKNDKYGYGNSSLEISIWDIAEEERVYELCETIPEYKINNIDNIFNYELYAKAIVANIKDYEENKKNEKI